MCFYYLMLGQYTLNPISTIRLILLTKVCFDIVPYHACSSGLLSVKKTAVKTVDKLIAL